MWRAFYLGSGKNSGFGYPLTPPDVIPATNQRWNARKIERRG